MSVMYGTRFGLKDSPFALTPDPRYLFLSDAHKEALASMIYGVRERRGFILILGEVGTGKTTLVRHILGQFGSEIRAIYLFQPRLGFDDLLSAILRELEIPVSGSGRQAMVGVLNEYLISELAAGRSVVLIIDEAQHLSADVLEELRLLSNLETNSSKLLQIILVGQPELGAKLGRPQLRQLRQRIGLVAQLEPLSLADTRSYIEHRLRVAGRDGALPFTPRAVRLIHKHSGGIPRLINVLCDKALVLAYGADSSRVGGRLIKQVLRDWEVFARPKTTATRSGAARRRYGVGLAAAAAAVVVAAMAVPLMANRGVVPRLLDAPVWGTRGAASSGAGSVPAPAHEATRPAAPSTGRVTSGEASSAVALAPSTAAVKESPAPVKEAPAPIKESPAPARIESPTAVTSVPARVTPAPEASPIVKEATARKGDTLAALTADVYGRADYTLLDFVKRANPSVDDVDVIEVGRRLKFPPFVPESMVDRQPDGKFVVHVLTIPASDARTIQRVRARIAAANRLAHTVPVQLSRGADGLRILAGDFASRDEAIAFATTFDVPVTSVSKTRRSVQ